MVNHHEDLAPRPSRARLAFAAKTPKIPDLAPANKGDRFMRMKLTGLGIALIMGTFVASCGPSLEDVQIRDARIAELEGESAACKRDREALNSLVTGLNADAAESKDKIASMQAALAKAKEREEQAQARLATFRSMLSQLKSMIDSGKLSVSIVRNRMVVQLPEAVLFPSGSDKLRKEGSAVLAELGPVLASLTGREFQVGGHTDNVPIRTKRFASNWDLSVARAVNVTELLIGSGLEPTRVSAAGYADTQPVASNDDPEGRSLNRRIEIALLPNLDELPDLSALEQEQ